MHRQGGCYLDLVNDACIIDPIASAQCLLVLPPINVRLVHGQPSPGNTEWLGSQAIVFGADVDQGQTREAF